MDDVASPSPTTGGPPGEGGGVVVVSQSEVGPYDAAILQATQSLALRNWLVDNGYDLTPQGAEALEPYVGQGLYFVALKLQQNKQVGDLRPIVVRFEGKRPCIPIKLTAIAARPDMPIVAYVLSNKRAIRTTGTCSSTPRASTGCASAATTARWPWTRRVARRSSRVHGPRGPHRPGL